MEGKFLPGGFAGGKDAAVLCGAFFDDRNQLHVSPHSIAENDRQLETTDAGEFSVRAEGAAKDHALVEAARLRRHARLFLQSHLRTWRKAGTRSVSASAQFQKGRRRVNFVPPGISVDESGVRVPSRVVV